MADSHHLTKKCGKLPHVADWCELGWSARVLSLPPRTIQRWVDLGYIAARPGLAMAGRKPQHNYAGRCWRIDMTSLRNWLISWSQTWRGAAHLARIGAADLLRRELIDEATAQHIEAKRQEYIDALEQG